MRLLRIKLSRWKVGQQYFLLYCLFFMASIVLSKTDDSADVCPKFCVCGRDLGIVNCSSKGLRDIPGNLPSWTRNLILENNRLTTSGISHYDFTKLESLVELDLSGNKIEKLNLNFSQSPTLQKISAKHCSLTSFPTIEGARNITTLELSHNSIVDLEDNLKGFSSLQILDLSFNKLRQIKKGVFLNQTDLRILLLQKNRISSLSWDSFVGLKSIETLDLSRNKIRTIVRSGQPQPSTKQNLCDGSLQTLKHLNLSLNQLTHINGLTFTGMCALETLRIDRNRINRLSDGAFYGPSALKILILDHNFIESVTRGWLFQLSSLETLSVAFNNLTGNIDDGWNFCKELLHLNLSHNRLTSLSSHGFLQLSKLQNLKLDNNKISLLEDFAFDGLEKLKTLDLSNNEISSSIEDIAGAFIGLKSVEYLSLRNNRIRSLSASALEGIESVVTLDLCGNDVTSIHNHTFEKMTNLKTLSIVSSSFLCDCQLAWFPKWLRAINSTRKGFIFTVEGNCFYPSLLKGRDVLNVSEEEFVCTDNPMPILLQEPTEQTALKGDNITFECRASAMFTGMENDTLPTPGALLTTTTIYPFRGNLGKPIPGNVDDSLFNEFGSEVEDSPSIMADAPKKSGETRRSGGFPLKADLPPRTSEKRRNSQRRRHAEKPAHGMAVMWKRSGKIIDPNSRVEVRQIVQQQGGYIYVTSLLVLKSVTSDDDGRYKCIVSNNYGYAHSKDVDLAVNQYPKFTETPASVTVVLNGSSAILKCAATGQPPPQIQWQKDGGKDFPAATERRLLRQQSSVRVPLLDNSDHDDTDLPQQGESSMRLKPDHTTDMDGKNEKFTVDTDAPLEFDVVLLKDTGEYECVAESSVGRIVSKAMFIVETPPTFSRTLPAKTKSYIGSNAVIQCLAEGIPAPEIAWSRNGQDMITLSRHFLTDDSKMLIISDVLEEDAGDYSCTVTNKHGKVEHTTALEVTKDTEQTIFTLLLDGDTTTWIFAGVVVAILLFSVFFVSISCIWHRRKRKDKALSTNTDDTNIERGPESDVNSYSSDGSVRRGQSAHSLHMVGDVGNNGHVLKPGSDIPPHCRASSSMSDISHMQIIQSPSTRSNAPLVPNGFIDRHPPKRSLSTAVIRKEDIPITRFRSAENFKIDEENRQNYTTTPASHTRVAASQPIASPSNVFAKKAARADNYVPVFLKTQPNGDCNSVTPSGGKSDGKKSKLSKKGKGRNQRQQNKKEQNGCKSKSGSFKNNPHNPIGNGNIPNSSPVGGVAVAGPRLLSDPNQSVKYGKQNPDKRDFPHRDRRKVPSSSPSESDSSPEFGNAANRTSESSSLLSYHNNHCPPIHNCPSPPSGRVTDRLLT